eukprot:3119402-Prymnesium_polylepis.1
MREACLHVRGCDRRDGLCVLQCATCPVGRCPLAMPLAVERQGAGFAPAGSRLDTSRPPAAHTRGPIAPSVRITARVHRARVRRLLALSTRFSKASPPPTLATGERGRYGAVHAALAASRG